MSDEPCHGVSYGRWHAWREAAAAVLACGLVLTVLFARLGGLPLMKPDEVRNAQVGREMLDTGAWLVPTYNGLPYLDKPAFFFRCVALSFAALGVGEAAARLPSAVSALALLLATFGFACRVADRRRGVLAAAVLASLPLFIVFARLVIMDMMFTLFVSLAIMAGFLAEEREGRVRTLWHAAGAACAALGVLVKGPLGSAVPWLVLGTFFVWDRRPRAALRLLSPLNLLILFGIVLPWFVLLSLRHPDFPHYGLVLESFTRLTTGAFRRNQPFYFYGPVILGSFFAWSLLLPGAVAAAWRARRRWTRGDRLCMVWAVVVVAFFSLSQSKQPGYILGIAVPFGILVARLFGAAARGGRACGATGAVRGGAAALAVVLAVVAVGLTVVHAWPAEATHWLRTRPERMELMAPHLLTWAVLCLGLAAAAACAVVRHRLHLAFAVFAACVPVVTLAGFGGVQAYARVRSDLDVIDRMPPLPPGAEVVGVLCLPLYVPFYLGKRVTVVTEAGREFPSNYIPYALRHTAPWPRHLVPLREVDGWVAGRDHPLYLVGRSYARGMVERLAAAAGVPVHDLSRGYVGALLPAPPREDR